MSFRYYFLFLAFLFLLGCKGHQGKEQTSPDELLNLDADLDTIAQSVDNCPAIANTDQLDADNDGIGSACDNCPDIANPDQKDSNNNGKGDACEAAIDAEAPGGAQEAGGGDQTSNVAPSDAVYVVEGGDDSGPGTFGKPYATIQKGIDVANASNPKKLVFLLAKKASTGDLFSSRWLISQTISIPDGVMVRGSFCHDIRAATWTPNAANCVTEIQSAGTIDSLIQFPDGVSRKAGIGNVAIKANHDFNDLIYVGCGSPSIFENELEATVRERSTYSQQAVSVNCGTRGMTTDPLITKNQIKTNVSAYTGKSIHINAEHESLVKGAITDNEIQLTCSPSSTDDRPEGLWITCAGISIGASTGGTTEVYLFNNKIEAVTGTNSVEVTMGIHVSSDNWAREENRSLPISLSGATILKNRVYSYGMDGAVSVGSVLGILIGEIEGSTATGGVKIERNDVKVSRTSQSGSVGIELNGIAEKKEAVIANNLIEVKSNEEETIGIRTFAAQAKIYNNTILVGKRTTACPEEISSVGISIGHAGRNYKVSIINNLLFAMRSPIDPCQKWVGIRELERGGISDPFAVENNFFAGFAKVYISNGGAFEAPNNSFDRAGNINGLDQALDREGRFEKNRDGDPMVDTQYQPLAGSPLIDNGKKLEVECAVDDDICLEHKKDFSVDLLGILRPQRNGWDIGAFEYQP